MTRWLRVVVRRPQRVLAVVALALLVAAFGIPRVRLRLDARALVPADDPVLADSDAAGAVFGQRDALLIGVSGSGEPLAPDLLARLCRLGRAVAALPQVEPDSAVSLCTLALPRSSGVASTIGPFVPEGRITPAGARALWDDVRRAGLDDGLFVARDGRAALLVADVHPGADRRELLARLERLAAQEPAGTVHLSGNALAQAAMGEAVARDLGRLVPAVLLFMGVLLTLAFAGPAPAAIALCEIAASLVVTIGLMGFAGQSVFVTTLVLPVVLIAVGVSDDVYVLRAYFDHAARHPEGSPAEWVVAAFGASARSVGLTTLSTTVGLVSLCATGLEPLRVFGVAGALAILLSSLFTFTLVPALVVVLAPAPDLARSGALVPRLLRRVPAAALRAAGPLTLASCALLALGCALACRQWLRVDDAWVRQLPAHSPVARGDARMNQLLAGTTTLDLLVDSGRADGFADADAFAALGALERAVTDSPDAGASLSVYDDVVRLHALLAGQRYAELSAALTAPRRHLEGTDIYLGLALRAASASPRLERWLDSSYRRARIMVTLPNADYAKVDRLLGHVVRANAALPPLPGTPRELRIQPFGDAWISHRTVELLVHGQVFGTLGATLVDLLLVAFVLRSLRAGLLAVLPVAFGLLVVLGGLAVTRTPLGIANTMFTGISLGIGLDFCIHFSAAFREAAAETGRRAALRLALDRTAPAIVTSAVSIAAGFLTLTLSAVESTVQLGWALAAGLIVCAAATLLCVPSLILAADAWEARRRTAAPAVPSATAGRPARTEAGRAAPG